MDARILIVEFQRKVHILLDLDVFFFSFGGRKTTLIAVSNTAFTFWKLNCIEKEIIKEIYT